MNSKFKNYNEHTIFRKEDRQSMRQKIIKEFSNKIIKFYCYL